MEFYLLISGNMNPSMLWIMASEMPRTAILTTIYPKFCTTFDKALFCRMLGLAFIVIHDFVGRSTTLGCEVVHDILDYSLVYSMTLEVVTDL